jgi:Flp pilus assembly protein TadG
LSSTINGRRTERGQVLVIFAGGLVAILAIAALVFDIGQNLYERRMQQDAADAAALAGARYMNEPACKASSTVANCPDAVAAALSLATTHGFDATQVTINIPPDSTAQPQFRGAAGHIQVQITATRPSYFAGVIGMTSFRISSQGVAANRDHYSLPYAFLSLNETACGAGKIGGNGSVTVQAPIMVDSTCNTSGALQFDGTNATITAPTCSTAGTYKTNGNPLNVSCTTYEQGVPPVTDPLAGLQGPTIGSSSVPYPPTSPVITGGTGSNTPPNGCPGSGAANVATAANPRGCDIHFNSPKVVRIYPGVYYGGLKLRQTSAADTLVVYMEPGIYYMAGGGFEVSGQLTLRTVSSGGTTLGGGVLVYNSDDQQYRSNCAAGTGSPGKPCLVAIDFQNTDSSDIDLLPYELAPYENLLFFQDRNAVPAGGGQQPAMSIDGRATMSLSGTIYLPKADFNYSGNGNGEILNAQVICDEFSITGNGTLSITYDPDEVFQFHSIGLVQ